MRPLVPERLFQAVGEQQEVRQRGEGVEDLALREIRQRAGDPNSRPVRIPDDQATGEHPAKDAGRVSDAVLALEMRSPACQMVLEILPDQRQIIVMDAIEPFLRLLTDRGFVATHNRLPPG